MFGLYCRQIRINLAILVKIKVGKLICVLLISPIASIVHHHIELLSCLTLKMMETGFTANIYCSSSLSSTPEDWGIKQEKLKDSSHFSPNLSNYSLCFHVDLMNKIFNLQANMKYA